MAKGIEELWLIGDDFVRSTINDHYLRRHRDNLYVPNNFEFRSYASKNYLENRANILARLVNQVIRAININRYLPKWVVFVVESDIVKYMMNQVDGMHEPAEAYQKMMEWVMTQQDKAINFIKNYLPSKAKKYNWPRILWIVPTLHDGFTPDNFKLRKAFIFGLRSAAAQRENTIVLPLRQAWDRHDESLFDAQRNRFTSAGLDLLWTAIDRTIRFADTRLNRNFGKQLKELFPNYLQEEAGITQVDFNGNGTTDTSSDNSYSSGTSRRRLSFED